MRLNFTQRLIRFLFYPISLFGCVLILNYAPEYKEIEELCQNRDICYSHCTSDNFPSLNCEQLTTTLEYNGNVYENFFKYPNPKSLTESVGGLTAKKFELCKDLVEENSIYGHYDMSPDNSER